MLLPERRKMPRFSTTVVASAGERPSESTGPVTSSTWWEIESSAHRCHSGQRLSRVDRPFPTQPWPLHTHLTLWGSVPIQTDLLSWFLLSRIWVMVTEGGYFRSPNLFPRNWSRGKVKKQDDVCVYMHASVCVCCESVRASVCECVSWECALVCVHTCVHVRACTCVCVSRRKEIFENHRGNFLAARAD